MASAPLLHILVPPEYGVFSLNINLFRSQHLWHTLTILQLINNSSVYPRYCGCATKSRDCLQCHLAFIFPYKGQVLDYSVRSTIPAPHENVAVQVLGNLLCPTNQGCRLSALSFLPHHHYIRTGHTYLIPLNTINMTPPKPPVQNPVDIPFEMV